MKPVRFFLSSRRRHTRCSRDWSSDVCSSDLSSRTPEEIAHAGPEKAGLESAFCRASENRPITGYHAIMGMPARSEEHTSELQSRLHLVCRLLLEKKKKKKKNIKCSNEKYT